MLLFIYYKLLILFEDIIFLVRFYNLRLLARVDIFVFNKLLRG
jgi:hypothetical protein